MLPKAPIEGPAALQVLAELSPFQRERGAAQMLQPGYVRSLLDIFQVQGFSYCVPPASLSAHVTDSCKAIRYFFAMKACTMAGACEAAPS